MINVDISQHIPQRPDGFIINDLKWKFLTRCILRGKNLMIVGPKGSGKTESVLRAAQSLNRQLFNFNMGSTQDPRSSLIGNTHFDKTSGTYFRQSEFITAIQTPNAVILLDEVSRQHPEAGNILMSVLDNTQRYLRIDESPDVPVIRVADGVSFIATANIGNEYTATRVMDGAFLDRFLRMEMDLLTREEEEERLNYSYPNTKDKNAIIASIYELILNEIKLGTDKISSYFSTRMALEAADLVNDGFSILEAAEVCIFPFYSEDGGHKSERTYVKQIVQRFVPTTAETESAF